MSSIPPDILGSAAQAGFTAREAARVGNADRTAQAREANRNVDAADDAAESVETTDADTAVFSDAEGAGGQGRSTEHHEPSNDEGLIDEDDSPEGGLDIRA